MLTLLSKYDSTLKSHIDTVKKIGLDRKEKGKKGGLLSKTTANHIIEAIRDLIKQDISNEVREAGAYSIQFDTTQDVTVTDQCSIIIR